MWRDELKRIGHLGDGAYVGLMDWFDQNPEGRLSTHEMGKLGLRYWKKGRREWSVYNQATLERKARDLRDFGLLKSYKQGGYVYFEPVQRLKIAPQRDFIPSVVYEPIVDDRGRVVGVREVQV